jgi:hypothetical protein
MKRNAVREAVNRFSTANPRVFVARRRGLSDQTPRCGALVWRGRVLDKNPNEDVRVDGDAHSGMRISATITPGCPGWVSIPTKSARRRVLGRKTMVPLLNIDQAILSPACKPSLSRTSRGTVTWPLLEMVVGSDM